MQDNQDVITNDSLQVYFHEQVNGAINNQHVEATGETAHYLSSLLTSYAQIDMLFEQDESGRRIKPLAIQLGEAFHLASTAARYQALRKLGDTALFIAGMFPGILHRKPIGLDYYIAMGGNAYNLVHDLVIRLNYSEAFSIIFNELASDFTAYVDVLSEVAEESGLFSHQDMLEIYEHWLQTGSQRAMNKLRQAGIEPIPVNNVQH